MAIRQLPLLPLRVDATIPSPLKSADLKELVQTIDGHIYAYKSLKDDEHLPASEFLCYRMAAACRLPVPFSALIEKTSGGEIGFGSRFEGGIEDPARLSAHDQLNMFRDSKGPVSAILALDHFVGNDDRHKGNFIFRRNFNEKWVPLAIDYSRALYVRGFPNDEFPLPPHHTARAGANIRRTRVDRRGVSPGHPRRISLLQLRRRDADRVNRCRRGRPRRPLRRRSPSHPWAEILRCSNSATAPGTNPPPRSRQSADFGRFRCSFKNGR